MDITFDTIDIGSFLRLPNVSAPVYLVLARALRRRVPPEPSEDVVTAKQELEEAVEETEQLMAAQRLGEELPEYGVAAIFDPGVDGLYVCMRARLDALAAFEHPGLDPLANGDTPVANMLRANRRKSERAQVILNQLFGKDGLRFTNTQYEQQAGAMGTILRLIDQGGLAKDIDALVGVPIVDALRLSQVFYQEMVADRLDGNRVGLTSMSTVRRKLNRAIVQYNVAVLAMLKRSKPQTLGVVYKALRPVDVLRERVATRRSSTGVAAKPEPSGSDEDAAFEAELDSALDTEELALANQAQQQGDEQPGDQQQGDQPQAGEPEDPELGANVEP